MAICTDGATDKHESNTHQNQTAFSIKSNGKTVYMDAASINYVVIPTNYSGGAKLGDVAVLIDRKTGKYVFCIIGDKGPKDQYREVSIAAAQRLGYPNASGASGPSGDFEFVLIPNSKINWQSENLQQQIDAEGAKYYPYL